MGNGQPLQGINEQAAAQLASIKPGREAVVTWTQFRALVGALSNGESVLEFRSIDGSEVHQFVLDSETRQVIIQALSTQAAQEDEPQARILRP